MSLPFMRKSSKNERRLLLFLAVAIFPTLKTASAADGRGQPATVANDAHAGAEIPTGFKLERYAPVWERNPFTLVTPTAPQLQHSAFDKLFLTSWLKDDRTEEIFIQNLETNEVQRITVEPNKDNLRLIALHLNPNPQFVEAVISDGKEQGSLKFRFDVQSPPGQTAQPVAQLTNKGAVAQATNPPNSRMPVLPATPHGRSAAYAGRRLRTSEGQMEGRPSGAPGGQESEGQRLFPAQRSGQAIPGKS
jgi:hypothetical protein